MPNQEDALRAEVAAHKASIRRLRVLLSCAKSALVALECERRGIRFEQSNAGAEEVTSWPNPSSPSTP